MTPQERDEFDLLLTTRPETFSEFYKRSIPKQWGIPRHVEFLCGIADDLVEGVYKKVLLSLPPGHGKSTTVTHRLPLYWANRRPGSVALLTGYNQDFAERSLSYPSREIARELGLVQGEGALEEWRLLNGSKVIAKGVGSAPTGVNPIEIIVGDDPIGLSSDALSPAKRLAIQQWWDGTIRQRFWPETRAMVIATRWHEEDLPGYLASQDDGWVIINLQAIAGENDPLGRQPGEALWPEAKPIEFLEREREKNPYWFEALYQGNPTAPEGNLFKPDAIQFVQRSRVKAEWRSVVRFDFGATQGAGDSTSLCELFEDPNGSWYADFDDCRLATHQRDEWIERQSRQRGATVVIPQDPGSAGKSQVAYMVSRLAGLKIEKERETGSKETRANPVSSQVNAGNIFFIESAAARRAKEQLRVFPNGAHDDFVDVLSGAFNWLQEHKKSERKGALARTGSWN